MVTSWNNAQGNCRRPLSRFNKINGRHDWTRTSDLYRVNFEVSNPKPFPYLAFPRSKTQRTPSEISSFDGELMASSRLLRPLGLGMAFTVAELESSRVSK